MRSPARAELALRQLLFTFAAVGVACVAPPPPSPPPEIPVAPIAPAEPPAPQDQAPVANRTYDDVQDARALLADGFEKRELRRAQLATTGSVYWSLAAAEANKSGIAAENKPVPTHRSTVVVAERHASHVRIVQTFTQFRLVSYRKLSDLHLVTARSATLRGKDGHPFANGCGVTLPAGARAQFGPLLMGMRDVEVEAGPIHARGRLLEADVDHVFAESPPVTAPRYDCQVRGAIALRDAPGGRVVAQLQGDRLRVCQRVGAPSGGAQRIRMQDGEVRVVGYAPLANVAALNHGPGSYRARHPRVRRPGDSTYWPGNILLAPRSLDVVGMVTRRATWLRHQGVDDDGMHRLLIYVPGRDPWPLRVDDATFRAAKRKHTVWLARIHFRNVRVVSGGQVALVQRALDDSRTRLSRCFDGFLKNHPRAHASYDVQVRYAASRPPPTLTARKVRDSSLESCMNASLPSRTAQLFGTTATFTIDFEPNLLID